MMIFAAFRAALVTQMVLVLPRYMLSLKAAKFMENAMLRHLVRIFGLIYGVHVF